RPDVPAVANPTPVHRLTPQERVEIALARHNEAIAAGKPPQLRDRQPIVSAEAAAAERAAVRAAELEVLAQLSAGLDPGYGVAMANGNIVLYRSDAGLAMLGLSPPRPGVST